MEASINVNRLTRDAARMIAQQECAGLADLFHRDIATQRGHRRVQLHHLIEVTHGDGLGGASLNYGFPAHSDEAYLGAVVPKMKQAKVSALLLPGIGTVDHLLMAKDLGVSCIRVATHCTEADIARQHIGFARKLGMDTVGFLMMAHMNSPEGLVKQAKLIHKAEATPQSHRQLECAYFLRAQQLLRAGMPASSSMRWRPCISRPPRAASRSWQPGFLSSSRHASAARLTST